MNSCLDETVVGRVHVWINVFLDETVLEESVFHSFLLFLGCVFVFLVFSSLYFLCFFTFVFCVWPPFGWTPSRRIHPLDPRLSSDEPPKFPLFFAFFPPQMSFFVSLCGGLLLQVWTRFKAMDTQIAGSGVFSCESQTGPHS